MTGPDGPYLLDYRPLNEWDDGVIQVSIRGASMVWRVQAAFLTDGQIGVGGMTDGSEEIWRDEWWFDFWLGAIPPRIDYWGNRVLWRSDHGLTAV